MMCNDEPDRLFRTCLFFEKASVKDEILVTNKESPCISVYTISAGLVLLSTHCHAYMPPELFRVEGTFIGVCE